MTKGKTMLSLNDLTTVTVVLAYDEAEQKHANQSNINKLELYPTLSEQIKRLRLTKTRVPVWFDKRMKGTLKIMTSTPKVYEVKHNRFSEYWLGQTAQIAEQNTSLSVSQQYEKLLYEQGARFGLNGGISKAIFQQHFPEIDLNQSQEWCVSLNGENIISAEDYYSGNFGDFRTLHEEAIAQAEGEHKIQLINQLNAAEERLLRANVRDMDFEITTSFVSLEDRVRFLNQYVSNGRGNFIVRTNTKGEQVVEFKPSRSSSYESIEDKVLKRVANFVTTHSFTTAAKTKEEDKERRVLMKKILASANIRFSAWVKSNSKLMGEIDKKVNDPDALMFRNIENGEPLNMIGINSDFQPRPHQAAFIRQQSRQFGGICGFDVGLGKTASALLTIQHLQSINIKKKTIFCVPNTTLTNWRKEAKGIYADEVFARCLFVGIREDKAGNLSVKSSEVPADLVSILDNKHDKIFMTMEAFESISLKDDTLERYLSAQGQFDRQYEFGERTADNERLKSALAKLKKLIGSKMKNELLELMGIDSLVIDEAHNFKNGKKGNFGSRVKWLSLADPSARGVNGAVKAWYIRGQNQKQDGVLCLTATPITNSPLEIYSMLSLAVGEEKVNGLTGIKGADQFLENFCYIETREESTVDGREVETEVFSGLRNVGVLRKLIQSVAAIKNADDLPNGRDYIPESEENETHIALFEETKAAIETLKTDYRLAKRYVDKNGDVSSETQEHMMALTLKTGETPEVLAHPFNFINKVTKTLLDRDLSSEMTRYFIEPSQKTLAKTVIEQFNKLNLKEERENLIGTTAEIILDTTMAKDKEGIDDFATKTLYTVQIIARLINNQIELTTTDFENQSKFLKLAEKAGLALDVKLGSKMAALLENVNLERANPKAKGGVCKQIIFCDMIGSHNKLKLALVNKANIPAHKIVIFNAKSVKDSGEVQEIQDGFNEDTVIDENGKTLSENKYEIIIANKKAEVGINLQKGTQAIHHLTVGWTPDSLQQRNGRGVRQGNYLAQEGIAVNVYHYDANGTFDSYKRKLIGNKASWINHLLYGDENKVNIENGLSKKDQEYLADLMGNEEAYKQAEEKLKKLNEEKRLATLKQDFVNTYQMAETIKTEAQKIRTFDDFLQSHFNDAVRHLEAINNEIIAQIAPLENNISKIRQELENETNEATISSKQKKRIGLESKLERRNAVLMKKWAAFVRQYQSIYPDVMPDEDFKRASSLLEESQPYYGTKSNRLKQNLEKGEQHPLYNNWEEESGAYTQMIEEYEHKLSELASQVDIDEERLQALKEAKAFLVENYPILEGDLLQSENDLIYVSSINDHYLFGLGISLEPLENKGIDRYNEEKLKGYHLIKANSPESEVIYQHIAKRAEQSLSTYEWWTKEMPEIEKYIDSSAKVKLSEARQYRFNDRNLDFSLILNEEDYQALKQSPEAYEHIRRIYDDQGVEYRDNGIYAPISNIYQSRYYWSNDVSDELFTFYVKYNYPLNEKVADGYFSDLIHTPMPQPLEAVENAFSQIDVANIESGEALIQKMNELANARLEELKVIEKGFTLFDYQRVVSSRITDFKSNIFTYLFRLASDLFIDYQQKQLEKQNAEKAKEKKALRYTLLANYLVVSGNTLKYQDSNGNKFRNSVNSVLKRDELDPAYAIAWLKKDKSFNQKGDGQFFKQFNDEQFAVLPANSWIIHKQAWDWLVEAYREDLNNAKITANSVV